MFAAVTGKLQEKIDEIGRKGFWPTFGKLLRDRIYSHRQYVFLERSLALPHREYSRKRGWEIRILDGKRDIDKFRDHYSARTSDFTSLFEKGAIAFGSFVHDILVGHMWFATQDLYESYHNHTFRLKDGEVYQTEGFAVLRYRGTLMVLDGMQVAHKYFLAKGYEKVVCVVDIEHLTNMKLHFRLGFEESGAILHTRKLLFYRWRRSTVEHYQGTRFDAFKKGRVAPSPSSPDR